MKACKQCGESFNPKDYRRQFCSRRCANTRKNREKVCSIEGCVSQVCARGWCQMHYNRWKRHGDPLYTKWRIQMGIDSKLYPVWSAMKQRCLNSCHPSYPGYGGRGVGIWDEWANSYDVFRDWAIESGYMSGLSIERIDNDGNYEPANCKWIPRSAQSLNLRTTVYLTAFDETKSLSEWVRDPRCRVPKTTIQYRRQIGWSEEEAIATPPYTQKNNGVIPK